MACLETTKISFISDGKLIDWTAMISHKFVFGMSRSLLCFANAVGIEVLI